MQVAERISKDTIYLSNIQYDSIYILQDKYTDRSKDTLLIKETNIEYRYKLLKDTVRIILRDSIPYEVRVIETKTERYSPWYARTLAFIGFLALIWFAFRVFIKIKFNR